VSAIPVAPHRYAAGQAIPLLDPLIVDRSTLLDTRGKVWFTVAAPCASGQNRARQAQPSAPATKTSSARARNRKWLVAVAVVREAHVRL